MTMAFPVAEKGQLSALKEGEAVEFELSAKPDSNGEYRVTRIAREKSK